MPTTIKRLQAADHGAAAALGHEAFGVPTEQAAARGPWPPPGRTGWGTFVGSTLAAKAERIAYRSHTGGVTVATCGLAGVTVAAEFRGTGLLGPLIGRVLAEGRARGDIIATLFASAPGIYRRYGFELITARTIIDLPTSAARAVTGGSGEVSVRRAGPADHEAIHALYSRWAAHQNGPLTRTGPAFGEAGATAACTGVTLAVGADGAVLGYARWDRGPDEGPEAVLTVSELIAVRADAYRALWRTLGSFSDVVGRIHLHTSGWDPAQVFLGPSTWRTIGTNPYMLRVDDVARAFTARGLCVDRPVRFAVRGDRFEVMNGVYQVLPDDDGARCVRVSAEGEEPLATYSPGGLALVWSGAQSQANVRMLGGLTGPDDDDAALERALGHWPVHIRDSF